jgi:hypothetical protein
VHNDFGGEHMARTEEGTTIFWKTKDEQIWVSSNAGKRLDCASSRVVAAQAARWITMKEKDKSGPKAQTARSNYPEQERESLRLGTQDRLREDVKDAQHDQSVIDVARKARFAATGEPSLAPCRKK